MVNLITRNFLTFKKPAVWSASLCITACNTFRNTNIVSEQLTGVSFDSKLIRFLFRNVKKNTVLILLRNISSKKCT
jgi:hypothetical protein